FGSSLKESGWCAILQEAYVRRVDIINHGYGGYNSEWARPIFPHILTAFCKQPPSLITIFFGANDSVTEVNKKNHVPIPRYIANITNLIETATKTFPESRIIVISPPPIKSDQRPEPIWEPYVVDRFNNVIKNYHYACCKAAASFSKNVNVEVIDTWEMLLGAGYEAMLEEEIDRQLVGYLTDGLHFAKTANEKLAEKILDVIRLRFPELVPDEITPTFPVFWEVDPSDLTTLFPKK
ncbi:isoamyl acetate-hydrolyzing esterase, partial [Nowakowskiella sp. JEL0078]